MHERVKEIIIFFSHHVLHVPCSAVPMTALMYNVFSFPPSILTISVLRTRGCMSSQIKLDYCPHIRFFMSALRGKVSLYVL